MKRKDLKDYKYNEEWIKEVISYTKASFNKTLQKKRTFNTEGINYLLDKIEEKILGDENKMDIKTKYNIGDKIWVVYENNGEVYIFSDVIDSYLISEDETIIYVKNSNCVDLKEADVILYDDTEALIEKIIKLDKEII